MDFACVKSCRIFWKEGELLCVGGKKRKKKGGIDDMIEELVWRKNRVRLHLAEGSRSVTGRITRYDARKGLIRLDSGILVPEPWVLKIEVLDEEDGGKRRK